MAEKVTSRGVEDAVEVREGVTLETPTEVHHRGEEEDLSSDSSLSMSSIRSAKRAKKL